MDWLHFIGRAYYTRDSFSREAQLFGVSRRVSLPVLRTMAWGEQVYLAQGDMRRVARKTPFRGTEVFGLFSIAGLSGLNPAAIEALEREGIELIPEEVESTLVRRGCGEYLVIAAYRVAVPLRRIAEVLAEEVSMGVEIGVPLLQGRFRPIDPLAVLPDVSFRWGYRKFDGRSFQRAYKEYRKAAPSAESVTLYGEFRVREGTSTSRPRELKVTRLYQIEDYFLAELYKPLA